MKTYTEKDWDELKTRISAYGDNPDSGKFDGIMKQVRILLSSRTSSVLEEILQKIDEDFKGRSITIYELGDWIRRGLALNKLERNRL